MMMALSWKEWRRGIIFFLTETLKRETPSVIIFIGGVSFNSNVLLQLRRYPEARAGFVCKLIVPVYGGTGILLLQLCNKLP